LVRLRERDLQVAGCCVIGHAGKRRERCRIRLMIFTTSMNKVHLVLNISQRLRKNMFSTFSNTHTNTHISFTAPPAHTHTHTYTYTRTHTSTSESEKETLILNLSTHALSHSFCKTPPISTFLAPYRSPILWPLNVFNLTLPLFSPTPFHS